MEQTPAAIQTSLKSTKPVGIGESEHNRPDQTILLRSQRNPEVSLEFSEVLKSPSLGKGTFWILRHEENYRGML